MITNVLEVGVLIQHCVIRVQEEVKRVLVEEVHLKGEHLLSLFLSSYLCVH